MAEVEPYYTQRELTLAAALVIQNLGLQGNFADLVKRKQEENINKDATPEIERLCSQEGGEEVEEDVVLGDIFKTPDVHDGEEKVVDTNEFRQSVLLMKGLVGMVMQAQTQAEKLDVLCSGNQAVTQPVYCVLSFFDDKMNKGDTMELDLQETWLEEAISSVTQLLNTGLEHPFLTTCMEICHEFLESSFISLGSQTRSQELKVRLVLFLAQFGHSRHLGLDMVRRIINSFSDIAERLREASNYNYTDTSCLDKFHILMNLVLELWPLYVASVIPCRSHNGKKKMGDQSSNKRKSQEDSRPEPELDSFSRKKCPKKRSGGGGGELRPLLSLAETRDLQTEVSDWRRILSRCTNRLSVMQPEFCGAIWKVDRFCQGLEHSLTFGSC